MKKMLRMSAVFTVLVAMLFSTAAAVFAASQYVHDYAGLFSESDAAELESKAASVSEELNLDLIILTIDNAEGKTEVQYADDFYDTNGFGRGVDKDGVLFLLDMDNRKLYISTTGMGIRYLTDDRITAIVDNAYAFVTNEDYAGAANIFLDNTAAYVSEGVPNDQYNYNTETGEVSVYRSLEAKEIRNSALIALAVGVVVCLFVKASYQLKFSQYNYAWREHSKFVLTGQTDQFVNQTVTTRQIRRDPPPSSGGSSGGSRSSVHTSSSGRSHGGGGRSF